MNRDRTPLALVLLTAGMPAVARSQVPIGSEFRVNTYTTGTQFAASVSADPVANFVVVWVSGDYVNYNVLGQRYDASGAPVGIAGFGVNSYTTNYHLLPSVASAPDGGFVVAWADGRPGDGDGYGVSSAQFDASGALHAEFPVNSYTTDQQLAPAVSFDVMGNFVVVWEQQTTAAGGIFGQRFSGAGIPQGIEFQVSGSTGPFQSRQPQVAHAADGEFVVVWTAPDADHYGVFGRRYDAMGTPLGDTFQVNSFSTGAQIDPAVASAADGSFIVVWRSAGADGSGAGVAARRYDPLGSPRDNEFVVNAYTTSDQGSPAVASDPDGNVLVVWTSGNRVWGQRYDPFGVPEAGEFAVGAYSTAYQSSPAVASLGNRDFVVVWNAPDGSHIGIFGQQLAPDVIFKNGF